MITIWHPSKRAPEADNPIGGTGDEALGASSHGDEEIDIDTATPRLASRKATDASPLRSLASRCELEHDEEPQESCQSEDGDFPLPATNFECGFLEQSSQRSDRESLADGDAVCRHTLVRMQRVRRDSYMSDVSMTSLSKPTT